jgi:hypothetical protein
MMIATFAAVGIFRLPLIPVVCVMAPISVAVSWFLSAPKAAPGAEDAE